MATAPPIVTLPLPYASVPAFKFAGDIYETEREALTAAIAGALINFITMTNAERVYEASSALLPLLQRAIVVRSIEAAI
jgi:hypothetical protein